MFSIEATAEGWRVLDGETEVSTHSALRDALDAALPSVVTGTKGPRLRDPDTGELNGAWRWLPASDEDDKPLKGALLDAESLRQLAESLNTRPSPIAIDGGPTPPGMLPSEVHGTAYTGGGTAANGWAHHALVARGLDGKAELVVLAELVPVVAREVDAGRIATGSIHFTADATDPDTGAARELTFRSHALTNDPADVSLNSANAARRLSPGRASMRSHLGEALMTKPVRSAAVLALGASFLAMASGTRGASAEALAKLYGMFGIEPSDPDASYKLSDSVYALREAAKAESAAENINGGGGAAVAEVTQSARTEGDGVNDPNASAARELDDAHATLWNKALTAMRDILGMADGDPATVVDALVASSEKLKGALAAAPSGGTQDGGAPPPDARAAGERAGLEALRSELASVRSENARLSKELDGLKPMREAHARQQAADAVDADARTRGRGLAGASRDAMIAAKLQGEVAYQAAWAVLSAPPIGDVMGAAGATGASVRSSGGAGSNVAAPQSATAPTARAAIDARAEELRAKGDASPGHLRVATAERQLREERPELFN